MRELSKKRKERIEEDRLREEERERDEERKRRETKKGELKKASKKKDRDEPEIDSRPPAVGAHGLARQDGVDVHKAPPSASSPSTQPEADAAPTTNEDAPSPPASETSHQPPPAPAIAHYETFGEDPTQFDDPTIYHIRDLTPDMPEEEKKSILCVSHYPHDNLEDLTPGTPPDMDFTIAKPSNQINYSTFQAYVEPYIRPLTEEDVAFLRERGDRVTPYIVPARGTAPYREVWAKEDGASHHDFSSRLLPNEARGNIESMTDDIAETDTISAGPITSRVLQSLRHNPNLSIPDSSNQQNGDVSMTNGESTAASNDASTNGVNDDETVATFTKPSTWFPETTGTSAHKFPASSSRDFPSMEQRTLQELRYSGFLTPEATPDYDSHYDDEVAERLRHLQAELQHISRENAVRKARVLELTEERMAMQEYSTIADDLDTQINTAYLKRNRTLNKPKKGVGKARPGQGGTGGVAVSRNAVSEGVRMLMDRRKEWRDLIGPVVDFGQTRIPKDSVFDKASMERLAKAEAEAGDVEGE